MAEGDRRGRKDREERSESIHTQQRHVRMYRVQTTRHTLSRMRARTQALDNEPYNRYSAPIPADDRSVSL